MDIVKNITQVSLDIVPANCNASTLHSITFSRYIPNQAAVITTSVTYPPCPAGKLGPAVDG